MADKPKIDLPPMESMLADLARVPELHDHLWQLFTLLGQIEKVYFAEPAGSIDPSTAKPNYRP